MFLVEKKIETDTGKMNDGKYKNQLQIITYVKMPDYSPLNTKPKPQKHRKSGMETNSDEGSDNRYTFYVKYPVTKNDCRQ